jgi:hypothetical protein
MRSTNIIFWGFILFSAAVPCHAQLILQGTVQDSLNTPIPNVNVYATGLDSVSIKGATYTDANGAFNLSLKLHHRYLLHIRSLGYRQKIISIPAFTAPDTLDTTVVLHSKPFKMKTLVVQNDEKAIIIKKDTIVFNPEYFERGSESTVEDILKELPGVNIKSNGKVTVNGKTIGKVMVGGDDLFGFNYQLLTKNLTAKAIKTVQVYKHYHQNSALKGVSHSEQTVINLKLKDSFKVNLFGSLTGYYDLDDHYEAGGNAISITKNFKGYLFENINNVGNDPSGNVYNLLHTNLNQLFSGEPKLGSEMSSTSLIETSPQHVPHLRQNRYLLNQTMFHALGGIYKPVKSLKIKGVGYFLPANRQIDRRSVTQYDPRLDVANLTESRHTHKNIRVGFGELTAVYSFSKKMNLKYVGKYNTFPEKNRTHRIFRETPLQIRLNNQEKILNQNLKFTRKIKKGQAYQVRVRYKSEKDRQRYRVRPPLEGGPFNSDSSSELLQRGNSRATYIGTDIKYWHKDSTWSWSVRAGGERSDRNLRSEIDEQPSFAPNNYWTQYRTFAAFILRKTFFDRFKTHAKISGNAIHNHARLQTNIDDQLFYVNPEVGFDYKFLTRQHIKGQYSLNHNLPAFENMLDGRWLGDYQSIFRGSDSFAVLPSNKFTFLYQYGNWEDDFVMNAHFSYTKSNKSYTTAALVTPTYNFSNYRLTNGRKTIHTALGLDEFIHILQSNLSFKYDFNQSSYRSYFNNTANSLRSRTHLFTAFLRTAFVGDFNFTVGADYSLSKTQNQTDHSLRVHRFFGGYMDINVSIGKRFGSTFKDKYYHISHAGGYNFLDVRLKYKVIKDRLTLFLNATNLTDEDYFRTIYLGDYAKYKQRSALNHRYVMIGAKLQFK